MFWVNRMSFPPPPQRRPANLQNLADLPVVAVDGLRHFTHQLLFSLVADFFSWRLGGSGRHRQCQWVGTFWKHFRSPRHIHRALRIAHMALAGQYPSDPVFQFTHVPGPSVALGALPYGS